MELDPQAAAAELLRRQRARDSLCEFSQSIDIPGVPINEPEDQEDPVTGKLLTAIERHPTLFKPIESRVALHHLIMMQRIEACIRKPRGRLMIFAPPGSAKSSYASVLAPSWAMGRRPNTQIILASYATTIAAKSRPSVLMAKECVNRAFETTLAEGMKFERRVFHSLFATNDQKEGMAAFAEKRAPNFTNS